MRITLTAIALVAAALSVAKADTNSTLEPSKALAAWRDKATTLSNRLVAVRQLLTEGIGFYECEKLLGPPTRRIRMDPQKNLFIGRPRDPNEPVHWYLEYEFREGLVRVALDQVMSSSHFKARFRSVTMEKKEIPGKLPSASGGAPGIAPEIKLDYEKAPLAAILNDLGRNTGATVINQVTNPVPAITLRSRSPLTTTEYVEAVATVLDMNGVGLEATTNHVLRAFDVPSKVPPRSDGDQLGWLDQYSRVEFESLEINPSVKGLARRLWYEERR